MNISEITKVRLLIIPLIAMLVVTMMMAGWNQQEDEQIKIDEGRKELTIEHDTGGIDEPSKSIDASATAVTSVKNKSSLRFKVNPEVIHVGSTQESVNIKLSALGDFDEGLDIETFRFQASEKEQIQENPNHIDFWTSFSEIEDGERWPPDEQKGGIATSSPGHVAYDGYDLYSNDFTAKTKISWDIPTENMNDEFTLKLNAIVSGLSKDVIATVDLTIVEYTNDFTEFYVLGESGKADDYPTNLTVDETGTVTLGVTNYEQAMLNYTLAIGLGRSYENMSYAGGIPENFNLTFSSNNTYRETDLTLDSGENWNSTVNFSIQMSGKYYMLNFYLLREGEVYRNLHLFIAVWEEQ